MSWLDFTPKDEILVNSLRVLYVEDNLEIREEMTELLVGHVSQVYPCQSAQQGLETYQEQQPDLIITDIRMAFMDGLSMVQKIRQMDADVPVIVTTAFSNDDYFIRSIDLGIDSYLLKPVLPEKLTDALLRCAKRLWNKRQRDAADGYLSFVLEIHPNYLMVLNRGRIEYLNQTFLNFARVDTLQEFLERFKNLDPFLDPHRGNQPRNWVARLQYLVTTNIPIVFMHHPDNPGGTRQPFIVSSNQLPEENRIVFTFADITSIENQLRDLRVKAFQDPLTGVCNREMLGDILRAEFKRAERHKTPLCLIMIDIDHFKQINDSFGHPAGDLVLQQMSVLVKENLRGSDTFARWGGEEFIIVTPDTNQDAALKLAEKIRLIISSHIFPKVEHITASFGVAAFQTGDTPLRLAERVDQALYAAKHAGRNCVRDYQSSLTDETT
ncbi:MAG: diguanylate cyclase [Magnetococcales bacterium]|nr:diguanylate cyclase [Magnetococcales bacterium]